MKSFLLPIAIIVGLAVCFVAISCRDFDRSDAVRTAQHPNNEPCGETVSAGKTAIEPVIGAASAIGTTPEVEDPSETMSIETKPVTGKPLLEPSLTETNPVATNVAENDPAALPGLEAMPVALPVATQEEAEKLNAEALLYFKKTAGKMEFIRKGLHLVSENKMKHITTVSLEERLEAPQGMDSPENRKEHLVKVPEKWIIDPNTLKGNCNFEIMEDGYEILSPDGTLRIRLPSRQLQNTITAVSFELSCNTPETKVKVGIEEHGIFHPGRTYMGELSGIQEKEFVNFQISALDHFNEFRAFLEISGDVTIHSYRIFEKEVKGATHLEGEIVERSELPPPEESDYPNCRFTCHFRGNAILHGATCPQDIALIIEGFEDYKLLQTDKLKQGDKIRCTVIPFKYLPEEFQSTQQADDLNLFMLENYYVLNAGIIKTYSDNPFMPKSGLFFIDGSDDYVSVFERHINPQIPDSVIEAQNRAIQNDLQKMNKILDGYDDDKLQEINERFVVAWEQEKKKDSDGHNRVENNVWRNINDSFWSLPEDYTFLSKAEQLTQESLDCFAALKKACEANGVQLIVSLVPNYHVIAARVINRDFRDIPDIQTATFVKQLSEIGVETIYSSDAIIQNHNRYPFAFFFPSNPHPSDTAQDVITDILTERLKRYHFESSLVPESFSVKASPHCYGNDQKYLFPGDCDIGNNEAGKAYTNREILYDGKLIPLSKDAPVITIGNSYQQTPMRYPDSFPTLLSCKLNTAIDWYRIGGYGPFSDIIIQFLTRADFFLKNKKVLVLCIGTDHLSYTNKTGTILNIAQLDKNRMILNQKKLITNIIPPSNNTDSAFFQNKDIWGALSTMDKSCFSIKESGKALFSFELDDTNNDFTIDKSKPLVFVVPMACPPRNACKLRMNDVTHTIPCFYSQDGAKFFNLSYELPAGTREITIYAEGKTGARFAIKDIQIWQ